jgi:hypothetical protein
VQGSGCLANDGLVQIALLLRRRSVTTHPHAACLVACAHSMCVANTFRQAFHLTSQANDGFFACPEVET